MAVNVLGNDIEVAADQHGHVLLQPGTHLFSQPIHPSKLVGELFGADRIAVRQINVHHADALDGHFKKACVGVVSIAGERRTDRLDRGQ